MKLPLPVLFLSVFGVTAALSHADGEKPKGEGGRMEPGERLKAMSEHLNLTPEQQEKIKAIFEKNSGKMKEMMSKGREGMTEADKNKVKEMMKEQKEAIGAVLTPEQREKMREQEAKRRDGGGAEGGKKRGPRDGEGKPGGAKDGERKEGAPKDGAAK